MNKLKYRVDCKSTYPFWETIAAFDCRPPAEAYARECAEANPQYEYRVRNALVRGLSAA
jgi:hypothetical protein